MIIKYFDHFYFYQWWKSLDKFILSIIIILFSIGLFFSLVSTSLIASDKLNTNSYFFFFKHLFFVTLGLFIIFLFSYLEKEILFRASIYIFLFSLILLILVPLVGVNVKGSQRWLDLYILPRIQPIEFVKPFFIIIMGLIVSNQKFLNFSLKFIVTFSITSTIMILLIIQPDLGQTLLIGSSWILLIFISGINLIALILLLIFGLSILLYLVFYVPKFLYIKNRIFSFFDKESGMYNFQSDKALESIMSGGFFGKGIGEGTLKNRVPEAHTDYIVSVISEEFGVIAIILILLLFLIFVFSVIKKIEHEPNNEIKLILVGLISLILLQTMIHVGVNIRLFPTTGMTLPYISYGGSSIIGVSILSGTILNLTKRSINL